MLCSRRPSGLALACCSPARELSISKRVHSNGSREVLLCEGPGWFGRNRESHGVGLPTSTHQTVHCPQGSAHRAHLSDAVGLLPAGQHGNV